MLDLDAIEARAEAATPGPWINNRNGVVIVESHPLAPTVSENSSWDDADLIAHARTDVPALVAELRAAREVVEAAVDLAERDGHKDDLCDDCGLGGHTSPCPWQRLDAALAAYRAVVGEAR